MPDTSVPPLIFGIYPGGLIGSAERQAAVLETVIRTIHEHRAQFNITHYEHFVLRDADSSNPDLFYQFGLLRDDYTTKPAFECYRQLILELGIGSSGSVNTLRGSLQKCFYPLHDPLGSIFLQKVARVL